MVAALPIPPLEAKISGVKEALSISLLICSARFVLAVNGCPLLGPVGWGTGVRNPYLKNAYSNRLPKKPLAHISSLASSLLMLILL